MLTNYKKIKHPEYKYELTSDTFFKMPRGRAWRPFRDYIEKNPVDHEYIKILIGHDDQLIMCLKQGYRSDGASGPTFDTPNTFGGAFPHDGFYQALRLGLIPQWSKPLADTWFRILLRRDGMSWARANVFYYGVHYFGASSCALDHKAVEAMRGPA